MSLLNMPWTSSPAAAICVGHEAGAVQALLLPGDGREDDGAGELVGGEHPGELEHARDTGAVVVGTRRVVGEVEDVRHPGVQVPGDHVEPLGGRGPVQRGDAVGDRGRDRDVAGDRLHERLLLHRHVAAGGGGDGLQLLVTQAVAAPMPAHRVGLAGHGVPGAELGQPLDGGLDPRWGRPVSAAVRRSRSTSRRVERASGRSGLGGRGREGDRCGDGRGGRDGRAETNARRLGPDVREPWAFSEGWVFSISKNQER